MAITSVYGFQYFYIIRNQTFGDFNGYGKLPFINNNLNSGASRFLFELHDGRIWLRSSPTTGNRSTSSDRVCVDYNIWWYRCDRYEWQINWTTTYNRRRVDSSRRTPSFNFPVTALWHDYLNSPDVHLFTAGLRLRCPDPGNQPPFPVYLSASSGDTGSRGLDLLYDHELPNIDNAEVYFEFMVDRKTGVIHRWLDDVELPRRVWTSVIGEGLANLYLHVGGKSTSISATAPNNSEFAVNDIYGLVDTSHRGDETYSTRLGPVMVDQLPVDTFLIDRFWHPPVEDPTITVHRVKRTDSVAGLNAVVGDTHADPATTVFGGPPIELDDEVLYAEVDIYAHREADGASTLTAVSQSAGKPIQTTTLPLQLNTLPTQRSHRNVFTHQKLHGGDDLNALLSDNFEIRVSFD